MDRGDWQAKVHAVAERHDLATKPPQKHAYHII